MGYREIFNEIKRGDLKGVYLFHGQEEYIKEQALVQAVNALVSPGFRDLNYQVINGEEVDIDTIINACETLPFMSEKRLVVVKDFYLLKGRKGTEQQEKETAGYLGRLPGTTCLIFYCHGDIDKRKALYRSIKKVGKTIAFDHLKEAELRQWVANTLGKHGKKMSPQVLSYFVSLVENNLEDVNNELSKLVSYVGDEVIIDRQAVDKVVTPTLEHSIFQLVDAIGDRKCDQALMLFNNLLHEGQPVQMVLTMIARQFRLILQCKEYYQKGYSQSAIAERLKLRGFVVGKCLKQARNFSTAQLMDGLAECLDIDYRIKSGKVQDVLGVEMLIVKMCNV